MPVPAFPITRNLNRKSEIQMQQQYYAEYYIYIYGKLFILDLVTICGSHILRRTFLIGKLSLELLKLLVLRYIYLVVRASVFP